jgi:hypothetical protein
VTYLPLADSEADYWLMTYLITPRLVSQKKTQKLDASSEGSEYSQ